MATVKPFIVNFNWSRIYVQTDPGWQPGSDYWHTNRPFSKNTHANYIEDLMRERSISGNFKNHSKYMYKAFYKRGDTQLIKEQTGHKSEAVMLYKKFNIDQKKEVSNMLSVLSKEMESITSSQGRMLEKEAGTEQRKKATRVPLRLKLLSRG